MEKRYFNSISKFEKTMKPKRIAGNMRNKMIGLLSLVLTTILGLTSCGPSITSKSSYDRRVAVYSVTDQAVLAKSNTVTDSVTAK